MAKKVKEDGVTVIINKIIPFKGFTAMNLFGVIFYRKEYWESDCGSYMLKRVLNHERIHTEQIREKAKCLKKHPKIQLLFGGIAFYFSYLWQCILHGYSKNPYELEAYAHQEDFNYKKDIYMA